MNRGRGGGACFSAGLDQTHLLIVFDEINYNIGCIPIYLSTDRSSKDRSSGSYPAVTRGWSYRICLIGHIQTQENMCYLLWIRQSMPCSPGIHELDRTDQDCICPRRYTSLICR